jgi:uncharacterized protein (UPF0210 family)
MAEMAWWGAMNDNHKKKFSKDRCFNLSFSCFTPTDCISLLVILSKKQAAIAMKNLLTVRTVTAYLNLRSSDFPLALDAALLPDSSVGSKVAKCATFLREMERELTEADYMVQTVRIATNPFGEWLVQDDDDNDKNTSIRLQMLDTLLSQHDITFCSVGPAVTKEQVKLCPEIVASSATFSCSAVVDSGDADSASRAAETILRIAQLGNEENAPAYLQGGLGNFRFCAAASCKPYIPFFPAAKAESNSNIDIDDSEDGDHQGIKFALGFENGQVARKLLGECQSVSRIRPDFCNAMAATLQPVQDICEKVAKRQGVTYLGIDSSLNPSLDEKGSVAEAMEQLDELPGHFGGPGTLGAAAEITQALQSLPGIKLTGYCGLMLPVCEDTRLAALAAASGETDRELRITDLLSISSVCGVGVDTVPLPGDCTKEELTALILDVAGIAGRWNKSLSCRVFPVPGKKAGDFTEFDSPYMVNSRIFSMS